MMIYKWASEFGRVMAINERAACFLRQMEMKNQRLNKKYMHSELKWWNDQSEIIFFLTKETMLGYIIYKRFK